MDFTTPDLKLTAYLTARDFDIVTLIKLKNKNLNTGKTFFAYDIALQDYNAEGDSINTVTKSYRMPTEDKDLEAGELCYIIGSNLNAINAQKELYCKDCQHYKLLSATPAKGFKKIETINKNEDLAISFALNGADPDILKSNPCADDSPLSIAAQYVANLHFLETCPKKEKLILTYNGKTVIIPKDAKEEAKQRALRHLNT